MCEYCNYVVLKQAKNKGVSKRKLHLFSLFFVCMLSFGTLGVSISKLNISQDVKSIVSSWVPKISDLGKLKFVINQTDEEDVISHVSYIAMPFENNYVSDEGQGVFLVNGLGGMVVKSCLKGVVTKIESGETKTIYLSHGKGLTSVYSNIDTLGVKEGDTVEKNTPLGVSEKSIINFKILYKNKPLGGLTAKDGEMTFL